VVKINNYKYINNTGKQYKELLTMRSWRHFQRQEAQSDPAQQQQVGAWARGNVSHTGKL